MNRRGYYQRRESDNQEHEGVHWLQEELDEASEMLHEALERRDVMFFNRHLKEILRVLKRIEKEVRR